ncbi:MAG TPA: hypothetical protein VF007_12225 [Stellaceae bacterium]
MHDRLGDFRGGVDHMLAIVQHQQQPSAGEGNRHASRRSLAFQIQPDRRGNRRGNQAGIGEGGELGQPDSVGKVRQQFAGDRQGEPRLADAASAGQGNEPVRGGEVQDLGDLFVAADQLRNRGRQICRGSAASGSGLDRFCGGAHLGWGGQVLDVAGELIAASGDGSNKVALGAEGRPQRRDLRLQSVLLDNAVGPDPRHQRVLAEHGTGRLDQRHQHVERSPAEPCWTAVDQQFPAMRQHPETPERDARGRFRSGGHRPRL